MEPEITHTVEPEIIHSAADMSLLEEFRAKVLANEENIEVKQEVMNISDCSTATFVMNKESSPKQTLAKSPLKEKPTRKPLKRKSSVSYKPNKSPKQEKRRIIITPKRIVSKRGIVMS
uniref:uncharacterized protein LOC108950303 n=1 Tax=Ciona intestinalis TaxID=7719 RepID=UPI000EF525CE|nr:uncharacterized protein LOC108950303 [Ciona intestinalis]|eukprot:XP_018671275.2 uncharacterized protein LOC108950303 [Ciona intestinalis]